ncbi:MAG TPA: radical SAM protein [Inquilinus sp.]|nr:radical SAM protein [Inquilinus sp.]
MAAGTSAKRVFELILIKPSHYDDDGYVIQWLRSAIPSNTLAVLYGLARDCAERHILGPDVEIAITAIDETNTRVRPQAIIRRIRRAGAGMVALVGVQSNQFPRAVDIAWPLREAGLQVGIGGFHVSGTIAMLPGLQPEVAAAQAMGISLFAGEAEGRLDDVLIDAFAGRLQPLYNFMDDLPNIEGVPMPVLPIARVRRTAGQHASFDAGRGCPFQCSFCTIINVQGRKSRRRSPDDVEQIIRENVKNGISRFFITDDNFARNKDWEPIFDRLIELREREKLSFRMIIQVDTMCHRIPHFIEKAGRAGVTRVFIGLENINPDSLVGAKKRQNKITEYRKMLLAWKSIGAMTYAGYILGFPTDTAETIVRDIGIIQRELPVDLLEFFFLTPLPGSEDHKNLFQSGIAMDADMNRYDLNHTTTGHPLMPRAEWERVYQLAWETYYSPAHMETVMRRAAATGISVGKILFLLLWFYSCISVEKLHPLEGGYLRRKARTDRRPGLPREAAVPFYLGYAGETVAKHWALMRLWWRFNRIRRQIKADPNRKAYHDLALTPVTEDELDTLEMFSVTQGAKAAAARAHTRPAPQPQDALV